MLLDRATLCVAAAVLMMGCASPSIARAIAPAPAAPEPVASSSPSQAGSAEATGTTGLTGAVVSSTEAPAKEWTDDRILAILVAANAADLEQATLAAERGHDVRVAKYAEHMRNDDHVIGE